MSQIASEYSVQPTQVGDWKHQLLVDGPKVFAEQPNRQTRDALRDYRAVPELEVGLIHYFEFYNQRRLHQSLAYRTPAGVHWGAAGGR